MITTYRDLNSVLRYRLRVSFEISSLTSQTSVSRHGSKLGVAGWSFEDRLVTGLNGGLSREYNAQHNLHLDRGGNRKPSYINRDRHDRLKLLWRVSSIRVDSMALGWFLYLKVNYLRLGSLVRRDRQLSSELRLGDMSYRAIAKLKYHLRIRMYDAF